MGFFSELEENLEKYITRFFKTGKVEQIQPVDIARQLAREMRRKRRAVLTGVFVPNRYEITLAEKDYTALEPLLTHLAQELRDYITEKAAEKNYALAGAVVVEFKADPQRDLSDERLYIEGRYDQIPAEETELQQKSSIEDTQRYIPVRAPQDSDTPPPRKKTALLERVRGGRGGKQYELSREVTVIGRRETCDICLADAGVSRKHAVITRLGDHFIISDRASTNGTYVNGNKISRRVLEPGDIIKMGNTVLTFRVV